MATVTMKVEGLRELGERMRGLKKEMNTKIARATTNAGAQVIKKLAIQKAPFAPESVTPKIRFQNLKKSIYVRRSRRTRLTSEHVVSVRSRGKGSVPGTYQVGIYNEFGTVKMSPQPFMRPAFDQGKNAALDAMVKTLKKRIERAETKGK